MWPRAEKKFWPWRYVGSKIIVRKKAVKTALLQRKKVFIYFCLSSPVPPTSLSSCAELLLQQLGFEVGGNFLVDTVLLRKYHFTEFKASYESAGTILCLTRRGIFSAPRPSHAIRRKLHFQNSMYRLRNFFTS